MKTNTVSSTTADNSVVSESEDVKKGVGIVSDDTDGELPGLGAFILGFFALSSLVLGATAATVTLYLIQKFLFKVENPHFVAVIMALWTAFFFAMTPTFGYARRVKTLFGRAKGR